MERTAGRAAEWPGADPAEVEEDISQFTEQERRLHQYFAIDSSKKHADDHFSFRWKALGNGLLRDNFYNKIARFPDIDYGRLRDSERPAAPEDADLGGLDTQAGSGKGSGASRAGHRKKARLSEYEMYDVHPAQEVRKVDPNGPESIYEDALRLQRIDSFQTFHPHFSLMYKNNLVEAFKEYLFIGSNSLLYVYRNQKLVKTINTSMFEIEEQDVFAALLPLLSYGINFIKLCRFNYEAVLVLALGDGRVMIYPVRDLVGPQAEPQPKYELKLESSAWGVDTWGNMIAVSCNLTRVFYFYYTDGRFLFGVSSELGHNVPDVSFCGAGGSGVPDMDDESVWICCGTITRDLFLLQVTQNPEFVDPHHFAYKHRDDVAYPVVIELVLDELPLPDYYVSRETKVSLDSSVWSVNTVSQHAFKEVYAPSHLGSLDIVDIDDLLYKSKVLKLATNPVITSDVGGSAWYHLTRIAHSTGSCTRNRRSIVKFAERYECIKKAYSEEQVNIDDGRGCDTRGERDFVVVTTESKIGLFSLNKLVCNATSGKLYHSPTYNLADSNRISIVRVVPEISTVIAASQVGYVTIFRMVSHRGIHSLREEFVIKNDKFSNLDTIIGIGVRRVRKGTYWIYITHGNGSVDVFQLDDQHGHE